MWWSRRAALAALAGLGAAALAGCGFTPVHAPGGAAAGLQGRIAIDAPADRDAFALVARLEERLGRADAPAYRLSYDIDLREEGVAVSPTNAITRFNLLGTARYTLRPAGAERVLAEGRVSGFTAYSATGTTVSTRAARLDAHRRLMRILADDIVTQILAGAGDLGE